MFFLMYFSSWVSAWICVGQKLQKSRTMTPGIVQLKMLQPYHPSTKTSRCGFFFRKVMGNDLGRFSKTPPGTTTNHWPNQTIGILAKTETDVMEAWRSKYHLNTINVIMVYSPTSMIEFYGTCRLVFHTWILWDLNTFRFGRLLCTPTAHHPT